MNKSMIELWLLISWIILFGCAMNVAPSIYNVGLMFGSYVLGRMSYHYIYKTYENKQDTE